MRCGSFPILEFGFLKNILFIGKMDSHLFKTKENTVKNKRSNLKIMNFLASCVFLFSLFFPNICVADKSVLFDWNDGEGTNWPGWTYYPEGNEVITSGHPGFVKESGISFPFGIGPRSFELGGYGSNNLAQIDTNHRAPSTSTGGSLKIFETNSSTHLCTWWVWYDGQPLSKHGITTSQTNRWSFYLKTTGMKKITDDGNHESVSNGNFHIGTYICWDTKEKAYSTGDGCPYEGPGNQHYYHYLTINSDAWIHVLLDNHPTHRRDSYVIGNDPTYLESGKHYLEHLMRFYFEIRYEQPKVTNMFIDEMYFYHEENNENEVSVTSPWIGYWVTEDYWEIGWQDKSWDKTNDSTQSTFEIRWSSSPISNDNFADANMITPLLYGGEKYCGNNGKHLIRRPNSWQSVVWTRFKLPDEIEKNFDHLYFAIKDVSREGSHVGTKWPYNKGDGHNSPSPFIRSIDYHLPKDKVNVDESTINPPGNFIIINH